MPPGNFADPEFGWGRSCSEFTGPVALLGPHSAALGMKFHTGDGLGAEYRNVHLPRSARLLEPQREDRWRRRAIKLNDDGTFRSMEPFITGFIQNND